MSENEEYMKNLYDNATKLKIVGILTAKERMRLQGFTDDYIEKAYLMNEPHIIAAQAGNSVTVNVIESIARNMT